MQQGHRATGVAGAWGGAACSFQTSSQSWARHTFFVSASWLSHSIQASSRASFKVVGLRFLNFLWTWGYNFT